jgi:hypothetical protein
VDSITKSQTFTSVVQGKDADYLLTVSLFSIHQPLMRFSLTVKMEAGWILKRTDNGANAWQESITWESTAAVGDAFPAVSRLRMATEGAAKKNIALGLTKICKLNL